MVTITMAYLDFACLETTDLVGTAKIMWPDARSGIRARNEEFANVRIFFVGKQSDCRFAQAEPDIVAIRRTAMGRRYENISLYLCAGRKRHRATLIAVQQILPDNDVCIPTGQS